MRTLTLRHDYTVTATDFLQTLGRVETWHALGSTAEAVRRALDTEMTVTTPVDRGDLPPALASRLPDDLAMTEVYVIPLGAAPDVTEIRMRAHAAGMPVEVDALIEITAVDDSRITVEVRAEISSSLPMFAAMVESALAPVLEKRLGHRLESLGEC